MLFTILYGIAMAALFIFALIQFKKHAFWGGIYFIAFLVLDKLFAMLQRAPVVKQYMESLYALGSSTINGSIFLVRTSIDLTISFFTYYFLIMGLYRMWKADKRKPSSAPGSDG